jgi:cytochrome d ubiquinol oxidase subunit I
VTEVGRQPWVIQGVMKTADSVTPADGVFGLFVGFSILYALLTVTVVVLLFRIAARKSVESKE